MRLRMRSRRESAHGLGLHVLAPGVVRQAWMCTVSGGTDAFMHSAHARRRVATCKSALTRSPCVLVGLLSMPAARGHVHGVPASQAHELRQQQSSESHAA
jgi:hypothetical protein